MIHPLPLNIEVNVKFEELSYLSDQTGDNPGGGCGGGGGGVLLTAHCCTVVTSQSYRFLTYTLAASQSPPGPRTDNISPSASQPASQPASHGARLHQEEEKVPHFFYLRYKNFITDL